MSLSAARLLSQYLWLVGLTLLVHGGAVLLMTVIQLPLPAIVARAVRPNPLYGLIHLSWGIAIGLVLRHGDRPRSKSRKLVRLGLIVGVFYLAFGIMGLFIYHPAGMQLDRAENLFHLLVGAIALLLAARLWP